jgi:hypothetical protein
MADYYWQLFPSSCRISILNILYCRVKIKKLTDRGGGWEARAGLGIPKVRGPVTRQYQTLGPPFWECLPIVGFPPPPNIKPEYAYVDRQGQERVDAGFEV